MLMRYRCWFSAAVWVGVTIGAIVHLRADDWPEIRGKGRTGVWNETGIIDVFGTGELKPVWRVPIHGGYSSPTVADGRLFVTDGARTTGTKYTERLLALEESTGKILWSNEWATDYGPMVEAWAIGPVAHPTIDGDRVYALGRMGNLTAFDVKDGRVLWRKDFAKDFAAEPPQYGWTGSPLVDGDRLICLVGGEGNAAVIALNKLTGEEIWKALPTGEEPGYNSPIIIQAGGVPQLIIWLPTGINSLNPQTGKAYWEVPWKVELSLTVATPVLSTPYLFLASHYSGGRMLMLDGTKPAATVLWGSEFGDDEINPWTGTPVIDGDYVYGFNSFGVLRCLEVKTGKRVWESRAVNPEHAWWASAWIVRNGNRYFINNDRGELIIAHLTSRGYEEIDRRKAITPTHPQARRREFTYVHWSMATYANKHVTVRNDNEIVRYSLAK